MKTPYIYVIVILLFISFFGEVNAQITYFGAGQTQGVTVTASNSIDGSDPTKTIDGSGMNAQLLDASRFLNQATFGANYEDIVAVSQGSYAEWIDDQIQQSPSLMLPELLSIWDEIIAADPEAFGPTALIFNYAWWNINMTNKDLLRQRVAYALSQILVTSIRSDLEGWGDSVASYYDIFIEEAFGNYKDILTKVALHPAMGYYLSHLNNPREDVENNIHPDENFAREIMQLFSIGLVELHANGTPKLDSLGKFIPTYSNTDIKQLAKIFTGLAGGATLPMMYCPDEPEFDLNIYCLDKTVPMKMFGWMHEPGNKIFLGQTIIGKQNYTDQEAMDELKEAIDIIFNHPNVGPFVAFRLIQRFTTSNPSPSYVKRVADVFADNGHGVRGDMAAVIKAILLDVEARSAVIHDDALSGKLREPFIRYTQVARSLPTTSNKNRYWNNGYNYLWDVKQHVMASPSVFNFYPPDYTVNATFREENKYGPEFKIHDTSSAISYINNVHVWSWSSDSWGGLMYSWHGSEADLDGVWLDTELLEGKADDSEYIINYFDTVFTHGQLTDETRQIIREALAPLHWTWDESWRRYRVRTAFYLLLISPDYNCVK
ncbi:MAG: DUF1800 domain-containing protein [Saprospiraceae bacterium]